MGWSYTEIAEGRGKVISSTARLCLSVQSLWLAGPLAAQEGGESQLPLPAALGYYSHCPLSDVSRVEESMSLGKKRFKP